MNEPDTTITPDTITRADDVYPLTLGGPNYPITLEPSSFTFFGDARCVMTITKEGRLVPGEGLSPDEATQGMFKTLMKLWEDNNAYMEGLKKDKERLDWLESHPETGANSLAHYPQEERGHVYANKRWVEAHPGQKAEWDHFHAPTVREALDAAMKVSP